jgi:hypothetical protein
MDHLTCPIHTTHGQLLAHAPPSTNVNFMQSRSLEIHQGPTHMLHTTNQYFHVTKIIRDLRRSHPHIAHNYQLVFLCKDH